VEESETPIVVLMTGTTQHNRSEEPVPSEAEGGVALFARPKHALSVPKGG